MEEVKGGSVNLRSKSWKLQLGWRKFDSEIYLSVQGDPHLAARRSDDVEPDEGVETCRRTLYI